MILEKENYKKMTKTSTDIISGLEQYADSKGPRIDLNSLYDDGDNEIILLGVGNILLTDEGLGVHVVKELKESSIPLHDQINRVKEKCIRYNYI